MSVGPFHAGELALQDATGTRERMAVAGTIAIRDHMPDRHRELFEKLPVIFAGALDPQGQPWATVLHGLPGFVRTPDSRTLRVGSLPGSCDPAGASLRVGASVGLLGLEPHTRRRNRANGAIAAADGEGFSVRVTQSFGNCPKYIHGRLPLAEPERRIGAPRREGAHLSETSRRLVEIADTFFIASSSASSFDKGGDAHAASAGLDVSHRGGRPGFVTFKRGDANDRLTIPDYVGNSMFNTLGNLLLWPKAGLLFIDWQAGHLLQLAVTTELQADGPALIRYPGARRLLHMNVAGGWLRPSALPLSWTSPEEPPQFANRP